MISLLLSIQNELEARLPPMMTGYFGIVLTVMQIFATLTSYGAEKNPETRAPYSKFAKESLKKKDQTMVPSRTGMLIIYTPACVVALVLCILSPHFSALPDRSMAGILVATHFAKRVMEVLYVHSYSGQVAIGMSRMIGTVYFLYAVLICFVSDPEPSKNAQLLGLALFVIGIRGNLKHHLILAKLRSSSSSGGKSGGPKKMGYVAPKGGLFDYVAAPHYMFELLSWLGIAIAANHLNVIGPHLERILCPFSFKNVINAGDSIWVSYS
eukprot:scaffold64719_cov48-Attheya_sp.AAC.1